MSDNQQLFQAEIDDLLRNHATGIEELQIDDQRTNTVIITTLEHNRIISEYIRSHGWKVIEPQKGNEVNGKIYESLESLMMNVCPRFSQLWSARLSEKLYATLERRSPKTN